MDLSNFSAMYEKNLNLLFHRLFMNEIIQQLISPTRTAVSRMCSDRRKEKNKKN